MINAKKLEAAVLYNKTRGYAKPLWRQIQQGVGATPDGDPGPNTARAVASYQARFGLEIDGQVGPIVLGMLGLSAQPRAVLPPRGLWLDMAPGEVLGRRGAGFVRRLRDLKIDRVQLMLTSSKRTEDPVFKWTPDQWAELAGLCEAGGVKPGLVVWPRPWDGHTLDLLEGLEKYWDAARPSRLEFDAEGNWKAGDVRGFASLEHAADALVAFCREAFPCELATTTLPEHFECSEGSQLARRCDVLIPQAYSVYKPGKEKYAWGEKYSPGIMQRWALARARRVPGVRLECGLAAWAQKFPKQSIAAAMSTAFNEASNHPDVGRLWLWSAKHILRHWNNANGVRDFVRALQ